MPFGKKQNKGAFEKAIVHSIVVNTGFLSLFSNDVITFLMMCHLSLNAFDHTLFYFLKLMLTVFFSGDATCH